MDEQRPNDAHSEERTVGLERMQDRNVFSWSKISYTLDVKGEKKVILDNLSGSLASGQVLAVLGPSGAGKSTFLDALAARKPFGVSGKIEFNGTSEFDASEIASYVEQDDALFGALTVRETLLYAARLNASRTPGGRVPPGRVDETLAMLGLNHVAGAKIGIPIQRGVSGGQKRRTTLGTSVVTRPKILFLDEPTSGLDSTAAFKIMQSVKELAQRIGMIVIITIHQPNYSILSLFDNLLILARGKAVYSGPTNQLATRLADLGFPCRPFENPADHAINLVNDDFEEEPTLVRTRIDGFASKVASGDVDAKDETESSTSEMARPQRNGSPRGLAAARISIVQIIILSERILLNYSRNLLAYGVRIGMYLGMGMMLALIWIDMGTDQKRLDDRLSVHFFSVAFLAFMSVAGIPAFLEERHVFMRERANGLYGPGPYVVANSLVNIPFLAICVFLFSVVAYWSIGLHPGAGHFFKFMVFVFLGVYAGEAQSVLIAAIVPIFIAALAIAAFANGFWMSVQGYFNRYLPAFWRKSFHYMDYETYSFQLLVNNDLSGLVFTCGGEVGQGTCDCMYQSELQVQGECAFRGDDVLDALGIGGINYGHWIGILIAIAFVYRILFYITLRIRKH